MFKKFFQRLKFKMIARQLRRPSGTTGTRVGTMMNKANEFLYDFTLDLMKPADNSSILEIGFGNGKFFDKLFARANGLTVSGLDFSETMYNTAIKNNPAYIEKGNLVLQFGSSDKLPFPDKSFDKVFCINVIYFWEEPLKHLLEIKRVLKPGGKFYATARTKESMEKMPFTQYGFSFYETQRWKTLLEKAGLLFVEEQYVTDPEFDPGSIGLEGDKISAQSLCAVASV